MNKITYLAIPYTFEPELSFSIVNKMAAKYMQEGKIVFSPISHSHPIALEMEDDNIQLDHDFWMKQDGEILKRCDELIILIVGDDGIELIENSRGVQAEIRIAEENEIPIKYKFVNI